MRRFATLNCLVDSNDLMVQRSDAVQDLRRAVVAPALYFPKIQQALKKINFKFHRTCSISNVIQECNAVEGQTLLMFWGFRCSDSRITVSMSASSHSSSHHVLVTPEQERSSTREREPEVRHIAQQTDISCRVGTLTHSTDIDVSGPPRGVPQCEAPHFTSPASSLLQHHSVSILGSVCALLTNKQGSLQGSDAKQATSNNSKLGSPGSLNDTICRICFGGESAERLVRPCDCRGTIAAVHRSCLERWLLQAATSYCELCRHHYIVTRKHKWSWLMSFMAWAVSVHGRALLADAWRGAALGACSVLGTARALHACDVVLQAGARRGGGAALAANIFSSLLIGIIGALNGLLTTWMLLKVQEHQVSWQAWRDSTLHVRVTLEGDSPSPIPTHAPTSRDSDVTVVARSDHDNWSRSTIDRSTNIADPFMVLPTNQVP